MANAITYNANKNTFFELGFVKISNEAGVNATLASEEITISTSTDNNVRYACDVQVPIDIAPTKKKFNFIIKKPKFFESDLLFRCYNPFDLLSVNKNGGGFLHPHYHNRDHEGI